MFQGLQEVTLGAGTFLLGPCGLVNVLVCSGFFWDVKGIFWGVPAAVKQYLLK